MPALCFVVRRSHLWQDSPQLCPRGGNGYKRCRRVAAVQPISKEEAERPNLREPSRSFGRLSHARLSRRLLTAASKNNVGPVLEELGSSHRAVILACVCFVTPTTFSRLVLRGSVSFASVGSCACASKVRLRRGLVSVSFVVLNRYQVLLVKWNQASVPD